MLKIKFKEIHFINDAECLFVFAHRVFYFDIYAVITFEEYSEEYKCYANTIQSIEHVKPSEL